MLVPRRESGLSKDSVANVSQIVTLDRVDLTERVGPLPGGLLRQVERGLRLIEPVPEAEDAWGAHVNEVAGLSLRSQCGSWYVGSNVPGKPQVFMPYIGGFPVYAKRCEEVVANGYEGFVIR